LPGPVSAPAENPGLRLGRDASASRVVGFPASLRRVTVTTYISETARRVTRF